MIRQVELAIIGGGPAGLAAATAAAAAGVEAVVFDEQGQPGGQIYRSVEDVAAHREADLALLGADYRAGLDLVQRFRGSGATFCGGATVWELRGDGTLGVSEGGKARLLQAKQVILAGGAMERPVPVPGWTLPGVMGLGAAQTLLKGAATVPSGPTVVAGSGPLVYLAAWQLMRAGVELKAVLLTMPRGAYLRALPHLPRALGAAAYLRKGLSWLRALKAGGVPVFAGVEGLRAEGKERLQEVVYRRRGRDQKLPSEVLLLHEGVVPNVQLSQAAGCEHRWDEVQLCWRPVVDAWGVTDQDKIAVAGDGAGIGGARAAEHTGSLAGLAAAARLGRIDAAERDARAGQARRALAREFRIRPFLDALYRPAEAQLLPADDDTLVCRCEEVTAGQVRDAVNLGAPGPNQVKTFTRAGMGPCQGRMCALTVSHCIANCRGTSVEAVGSYRVRPPIKPLTVGEAASLEGVDAPLPTGAEMPLSMQDAKS